MHAIILMSHPRRVAPMRARRVTWVPLQKSLDKNYAHLPNLFTLFAHVIFEVDAISSKQ